MRKARFFQTDSYVSIDYAAQEVEVYRLLRDESAAASRPIIKGGKLDVTQQEPLLCELTDFVDAVRTGRAPGVPGEAGREALRLATRVAAAIEEAV